MQGVKGQFDKNQGCTSAHKVLVLRVACAGSADRTGIAAPTLCSSRDASRANLTSVALTGCPRRLEPGFIDGWTRAAGSSDALHSRIAARREKPGKGMGQTADDKQELCCWIKVFTSRMTGVSHHNNGLPPFAVSQRGREVSPVTCIRRFHRSREVTSIFSNAACVGGCAWFRTWSAHC